MALYKMQITSHSLTAHKILKNEIQLILPKFHTEHRNKRGIFGTIISGFLGLAFKGISSFYIIKDIKPSKWQLRPCLFQESPKEIN